MSEIQHWTYDDNGNFISVPTMNELCNILKTKFKEQEQINDNLKIQLAKLNDKKWKDKELQQMKEELTQAKKEARSGFHISEEESKSISDWIEQHEKNDHNHIESYLSPRGGAIGGNYEYKFIPTTIGTVGTIQCCSCFKSFTFRELN